MTDAEIKQAENAAREHLNRVRTLEARIVSGRGNASSFPGVVPVLCETILKLTAELKQQRGMKR